MLNILYISEISIIFCCNYTMAKLKTTSIPWSPDKILYHITDLALAKLNNFTMLCHNRSSLGAQRGSRAPPPHNKILLMFS